MKDIKAKVLSNENIAQDCFKIVLDAPSIMREAKPGQFVQVRCSDTLDPLLRRPLSIHRLSVIGYRLSVIELLYEVVGKGTEILSRKKKGETIDILGSLGNGFTLLPITDHRSPITVLIAGGIGVAPLVFLAEKLREVKSQKSKGKIIVLIGARTKRLILCEKDFKKLGCEVHIATDDGSRGYKGFVSELLVRHCERSEAISKKDCFGTSCLAMTKCVIYACGPHPMLKSVAKICREQKMQCQVCMEEVMACGIGACLGCAVKVKTPSPRRGEGRGEGKKEFAYKLACKDGPVFDAEEIIWQ